VPFWKSIPGKILRWIVFLPIGFVAAAVLETIPLLAYRFASTFDLKLTLLTLVIGIIVASATFTLFMFWLMAVFLVPGIACQKVAPHAQIASVIFGTLFVLFRGISLVSLWTHVGWGTITYKVVFSAILFAGIVVAYVGRWKVLRMLIECEMQLELSWK